MTDAMTQMALAVLAMLWVRVTIVGAHREHRLQEIHTYNIQVIYYGDADLADTRAYSKLGSRSQMMMDVSRWTYRQFYPETLDAMNAISWKQMRARLKEAGYGGPA